MDPDRERLENQVLRVLCGVEVGCSSEQRPVLKLGLLGSWDYIHLLILGTNQS